MKQRMEQCILLAIAVVSGATASGLDPTSEGLMLAALNVALAFALGFDEPGRFWAGGVLAARAAAACSCCPRP